MQQHFLNLFHLLTLFSVLIRITHHRPTHFSISLMMGIDFAFSFSAAIFRYQDLFWEIILRLDYYLLRPNLCILSLMRRLIIFSVSVHLTRRCALLDNSLYQFLVKFHSNLLNIYGILLNNLLIDLV